MTVGRWEKDRHTQTDKHTDRQDIVCSLVMRGWLLKELFLVCLCTTCCTLLHGTAPSAEKKVVKASLTLMDSLAELLAATLPGPGSGSTFPTAVLLTAGVIG